MGYGQHQSFYLRDRWISKVLKNIPHDKRFFYSKDAFEKVGLGKNMVQSLRFWVVATGLVKEVTDESRKRVHKITEFGSLVNKYDRFIKFYDTAAILHYHMTMKKEPSTAWYWFYNLYNESISSKESIIDEFLLWVEKNEDKLVSPKSLKKDIDVLIKLYTAGLDNSDPEEVILSPLNKLGILEVNKGLVIKKEPLLPTNNYVFFLYILLSYCKENNTNFLTVDQIVNKEGLPGRIFNLKRGKIVNLLNRLTDNPNFPVVFTRTNNLDVLQLPSIEPLEYLEYEFKRKVDIQA
jgi:hypothetical protein